MKLQIVYACKDCKNFDNYYYTYNATCNLTGSHNKEYDTTILPDCPLPDVLGNEVNMEWTDEEIREHLTYIIDNTDGTEVCTESIILAHKMLDYLFKEENDDTL